MKVTWFEEDAFRVQAGGKVLVLHPSRAAGINARELLSGADMVVEVSDRLPKADPVSWRPTRTGSLLEDDSEAQLSVLAMSEAVVVSAAGEPPLVFMTDALAAFGRWSHEAVVVVTGPSPQSIAKHVLQGVRPALMLVRETDLDLIDFEVMKSEAEGTAIQVLEAGMGIEFV